MDSSTSISPDNAALLVALGGLSIARHILLAFAARQTRRRPVEVGRVSRLIIYPVKSLKGLDVSRFDCPLTGPVATTDDLLGTAKVGNKQDATSSSSSSTCWELKDRIWMVTTEKYKFVTARQKPQLLTVVPSLEGNCLHLNAPGMETLIVPMDDGHMSVPPITADVWGQSVEGVDCGDTAAKWISVFLGYDLGRCEDSDPDPTSDGDGTKVNPRFRLIYHRSDLKKRRVDDGDTQWHKMAQPDDQVAFSDGFPFMLMSETSVEDLNQRLMTSSNALPSSMDNFRPNIVAADCLAAFDEDDWREIYINDAVFINLKRCQRCTLTTVDPVLGKRRKDGEPLKTLRRYRLVEPTFGRSPCMGINLVIETPGTIHVGDVIRAVRR